MTTTATTIYRELRKPFAYQYQTRFSPARGDAFPRAIDCFRLAKAIDFAARPLDGLAALLANRISLVGFDVYYPSKWLAYRD